MATPNQFRKKRTGEECPPNYMLFSRAHPGVDENGRHYRFKAVEIKRDADGKPIKGHNWYILNLNRPGCCIHTVQSFKQKGFLPLEMRAPDLKATQMGQKFYAANFQGFEAECEANMVVYRRELKDYKPGDEDIDVPKVRERDESTKAINEQALKAAKKARAESEKSEGYGQTIGEQHSA